MFRFFSVLQRWSFIFYLKKKIRTIFSFLAVPEDRRSRDFIFGCFSGPQSNVYLRGNKNYSGLWLWLFFSENGFWCIRFELFSWKVETWCIKCQLHYSGNGNGCHFLPFFLKKFKSDALNVDFRNHKSWFDATFPIFKICKLVFDASDVYFWIEKATFDATFAIFRFEKLRSDRPKSNFISFYSYGLAQNLLSSDVAYIFVSSVYFPGILKPSGTRKI